MEMTTDMSAQIGELAAALATAQGEITGALKDSKNPFFKSSYADLASCWDSCRGPLSKNKLAVIQTTQESTEAVKVLTTLAHSSGQWIRGTLVMRPVKADPQGIGSCITYARRYALAAMVGLAQVDDDANQASGKSEGKAGWNHNPRGDEYKKIDPKIVDEHAARMRKALDADKDEIAMADDIYEIHCDLVKDNDLYIAVADRFNAKDRKAIKDFIAIYKTRNAA